MLKNLLRIFGLGSSPKKLSVDKRRVIIHMDSNGNMKIAVPAHTFVEVNSINKIEITPTGCGGIAHNHIGGMYNFFGPAFSDMNNEMQEF